ncbi:MAG: hypothetical protein JWQ38_1466 [Flavipsychrobacter sp.]|nr:hypothetical protein [Flavipsychrobacter sp.]
MNNYEWLIGRLDVFIRKYYANKVLRGGLVFLSCLLFYILSVSVSEYYLYLPVWLRITIMSVFVVLGLSSLIVWVIIPLTKMARMGKVISHEQAANIIGTHFPEVSDRLLNILQLKKQNDNTASRELAEASINQKISQISVVPITNAVDFSKNRKYLPYLLPLVLAGVFILVAAPNIFKEGSSRLLQPTKAFEKPSPFQFIIKNTSLTALRNADFTLTLEVKGNALPQDAYIEIGSERVPMQPMENHAFQYTFKNVTDAVTFRFFAAGFYSPENTLKVVQRPVLKSFKVQVNYPAYIGKKNETRTSLSDMTLPVGTTVSWALVTDHTDEATIHFGAGAPAVLPKSSSTYSFQYRFLNDTAYTITLHNKTAGVADSYRYQVQVIPDQFPVVQVQQFKDSISGKQILLTGSAGDDYSITRVSFIYEVSDKNKVVATKSIPVKIAPGAMTTFQQYFDIQSLNLQQGQKLSYYIEAWDNDGVHGSKSSRSEVMTYLMYNDKQIDSAINENSKQISSGISNSAQRTQQLQGEYKSMQSKMLQSDNMDWEQQQSLKEMMKKQMDLKNNIENIKQRFEEQMQQTEQKKFSDDLKEKQKELDKQLDNLLNNELKEEMKKLQDLMQKLNKEQMMEAMKQMEQDNKLFKMDMDRMQELMKKMEMQMRMEDMANKIDDLAKKERELQAKTEAQKDGDKQDGNDKDGKKDGADKDQKAGDKKDSKSALAKEQKDLKDKLDKLLKEDMKETQKAAKDAKQNDRLENEEEAGKDAEKDMEESEDALDKKENSKAGKAQDKAAKKMESMAKSMRKKSGEMDNEEIEIDIKATRQILSNLIRLSFDQEDLMEKVKTTSPASQAYITNQEEQNRLYHNSQMIRDSMFALSKRVVKMATAVNKGTTDLEYNMQRSVEALEIRRPDVAVAKQQYSMTRVNELALMLNELLANLMQMKEEGKKEGESEGDGACSKPGSKPGNKPGKKAGKQPGKGPGGQLADIITEQKKLGDAMQQMQNSQGKKQGGEKPGDKPGSKPGGSGQNGQGNSEGENGNTEQIARLAQQQAAIRRKIQELNSMLNSKGLGGGSSAKELKELEEKMDRTETDLVNKRLGAELQLRQKEILTRMLETEKSLREQEQDDKRSSHTAQDLSRPLPPALQKYITDQKQLLDLYKTVPPQLKPYYRDMVENYFHIIGNK